ASVYPAGEREASFHVRLTGRRYMAESEGAGNFLELARQTVNARRREPKLRPRVYSATFPLVCDSSRVRAARRESASADRLSPIGPKSQKLSDFLNYACCCGAFLFIYGDIGPR